MLCVKCMAYIQYYVNELYVFTVTSLTYIRKCTFSTVWTGYLFIAYWQIANNIFDNFVGTNKRSVTLKVSNFFVRIPDGLMLFMLPKIWQIPCILLYLLYFISYWYPVCIAMEGCHKMWLKAFLLYVVKHNNIRPETFVYLQSLLLFRITSFNGMLYIHNNVYMIYIICKVFDTL